MAFVLPERKDIDTALTWNLDDMFASDAEWEADFNTTQKLISSFNVRKGSLSSSPETLLDAMNAENEISLMLERLYVYAHMHRDEDNSASLYQGMTDRAMQLSVNFAAAASFMAPEILALPQETLASWIELDILAPYKRVLKQLERRRAHTLSEDEEKLLAMVSEPLDGASTIFTMLNNADIRFGVIKDENGDDVELTHGNYRNFIESADRSIRKNAYNTMYSAYSALKNTLSATYSSSVKADVFAARARNHKNVLDAALFSSNVPESVYNSLISTVESNLKSMEEYLILRKRALKLDELKMYDLYTPIVPDVKKHIEYDDAKKLVLEALSPLGSEYNSLLNRAYNERWIDVSECRGKTSGAYSWGAYGTHPYVLLNYQPTEDYAFTLAHELGHAMHTYYSDEALPYQDAQYKIMAAEVASTVNEVLLTRYLFANESDRARKAYILNHFLEQFRTTVFRQTMFAAFEKRTHEMCENGEPLTVDALCAYYKELNSKYYPGVALDDNISLEWARIPHFYNSYYVYQYATGFSAAVAIVARILSGDELNDYIKFLKSGGSNYPIELIKIAGVDLTKPESISVALDEFKDSVHKLSALI